MPVVVTPAQPNGAAKPPDSTLHRVLDQAVRLAGSVLTTVKAFNAVQAVTLAEAAELGAALSVLGLAGGIVATVVVAIDAYQSLKSQTGQGDPANAKALEALEAIKKPLWAAAKELEKRAHGDGGAEWAEAAQALKEYIDAVEHVNTAADLITLNAARRKFETAMAKAIKAHQERVFREYLRSIDWTKLPRRAPTEQESLDPGQMSS